MCVHLHAQQMLRDFGGGDAEFQSFEILALLSDLFLSELLFFSCFALDYYSGFKK